MSRRRFALLFALANGAFLFPTGCSGVIDQGGSTAAEIRQRCKRMGFDDAVPDSDHDGDEVARGWKCVHRDGGTSSPADMGSVADLLPPTTSSPDLATAPQPDLATAPQPDLASPPDLATPPDLTPPPAPAVSFSGQVQPIFTASCAGCHSGGTFPTLTAGSSYSQLVNVASRRCSSAVEVLPGQPAQSFLIAAVTPGGSLGTCSGGFMAYLSSAQISTISAWIAEGAPNN